MQVVDKYTEQNCPMNWALRSTAGDQMQARCTPIHQNTLSPTLQPGLHQACCVSVYLAAGWLVQKSAVRESIKYLTKIQKNSFTAFHSSTSQVTLSQKDTKSVRQEFPFMNLCWLCLMSALPFKCLSIAPIVTFSVIFFPVTEVRLTDLWFLYCTPLSHSRKFTTQEKGIFDLPCSCQTLITFSRI